MSGSEFDDLAQGEIDGVISSADSARLKEIAAGSPGHEARLASLRRASEALGRAERLDPPPGFADDVMRSLGRAPEVRPGWREALRALFSPIPLAASAAALVLGFVLGGLVPEDSGLFPRSERAALSGTALPGDRLAGAATLDRKAISWDGLAGEAVTRLEKGLVVLDVALEGAGPVDVSVDLSGTGLSPRGFSQDGPSGGDVTMSASEVRFTHPAGRGRYSLSFSPGGDPAGEALRLRVGDGREWSLALGGRESR